MIAVVLVSAAMFAAVTQTAGSSDCACPASRQFPGGVVDGRTRTAFVANPENGISALALDSGAVLWDSKDAVLPVATVDGALVALRRAANPRDVEAVLLDTRTGSLKMISQPFHAAFDPLSDWALESMLFAVAEDKGEIVLAWREIAPKGAGAVRDTGPETAGGSVRLQRDGTVKLQRVREAAPESAVSAPYQRGKQFAATAWGKAGCSRALVVEPRGESLSVSLLCSSSQPSATRHELQQGRTLAATVSLDGCAIFIEAAGGDGPVWTAYASEAGERLATFRREPGAWNPAVVGRGLYYLVDRLDKARGVTRQLQAVDANTGKMLWNRPVRGGRPGRAY